MQAPATHTRDVDGAGAVGQGALDGHQGFRYIGAEGPAMTEQSHEASERSDQPASGGEPPDPSQPRQASPGSEAASPQAQKAARRRKLLLAAVGAVAVIAVLAVGIPWTLNALNTVSTDDAYVNGHVTFVAARVRGQVARVLVDDNNRVRKGDLIVELDKEPYQVAVAIKRAAVDLAQADLQAATATVRGIEAEARSRHWNLQHAMEDVADKIAELHARVASIDKSKAELTLAELDFERGRQLVAKGNIPRAEFDHRQATLLTARAMLVQALADVNQVRVSLGLKTLPLESADLGEVPPDLDQTFSAVREAQAELIQSAAQLGVLESYNQSPKKMLEEFEQLGGGDVDLTFARLAAKAPAVRQAEAKLETARRDLAQAELELSYCNVIAEIDGVITRRNVNPGNNVQAGQALMAIRSLDEIWIDANFKETELRDLRIGQSVDLHVDMYGGRRTFKGRIAGFTMGTGSTLALLPAQNATGNFIKVVQRLPVRIELVGYDPQKTPLFIGTSVTPEVHINQPATGPDAGKFLQSYLPQPPASTGAGAAAPGSGK
jgi:membrane fusion protein, multidrug efflux system